MVYTIPALCIALATGVGYWLFLRGQAWISFCAVAVLVAAVVWAIWTGRQQTGFDGVAYAILVVLILGPLIGGLLTGTAIAWVRRWREKRSANDA